MLSGLFSQSLVEFSTSVNRKVTVPLGGATIRYASSFSLDGTIAPTRRAVREPPHKLRLQATGIKLQAFSGNISGDEQAMCIVAIVRPTRGVRWSVGAVGLIVLFGILVGRARSRVGLVLGEPFVAFDRELRCRALQPFRQPPACGSEEGHYGGYEHATDDGGIDGDCCSHAEAELFDGGIAVYHEGEEDGDHDHRRRGDHARRGGQAVDDSLMWIVGLFELLADVGHQEDLVVHGEAEEDGEHHQRHVGDYRDGPFEADQAGSPLVVEGVGGDAEGGEDGEHVHHNSLERDQKRTKGEQEQQEREDEHDPNDQRKLVRDLARQIDVARRRPADVRLHMVAFRGLGEDVITQVAHEVLGRARGGRGGRGHGVDGGGALLVDQRISHLVHALGLLKVLAQVGQPRVRGLRLQELLLFVLPGALLLLGGLLLDLLLYGLVFLGLLLVCLFLDGLVLFLYLLLGLLVDGLVLLVYLLLGLFLDRLVLLVYLLLGRLVDGCLPLGPRVLLGLVGLGLYLLIGLLLLLLGLSLDLLLRLFFLLAGLGVDLLFRLLLRLLGLLLDLLCRFGLLFGDLLLRGFLLLVLELVEVGLVVVGRLAQAHGDEHGAVRARTEPFGHRVVGLPRLGGRGQSPVVGLAEVEVAYR